jgi:hypothetical protein
MVFPQPHFFNRAVILSDKGPSQTLARNGGTVRKRVRCRRHGVPQSERDPATDRRVVARASSLSLQRILPRAQGWDSTDELIFGNAGWRSTDFQPAFAFASLCRRGLRHKPFGLADLVSPDCGIVRLRRRMLVHLLPSFRCRSYRFAFHRWVPHLSQWKWCRTNMNLCSHRRLHPHGQPAWGRRGPSIPGRRHLARGRCLGAVLGSPRSSRRG